MTSEKNPKDVPFNIYIMTESCKNENIWITHGDWKKNIRDSSLADLSKAIFERLSGSTDEHAQKPIGILIRDATAPSENLVENGVPVFNFLGYIHSRALRKAIATIAPYAFTPHSVLIEGDTGTGKEVLARSIWRSSGVRGPFTKINIAAMSKELVESELFGHKKGAFTGAVSEKRGLVEVSAGGVVFLDEIESMEEPIQIKLLNFLQDGTYRRVGDTETRRANVRIIAATNIPVDTLHATQRLRGDLYYRLNQGRVRMPSLREQPEAIWPTFQALVEQESQKVNVPTKMSDEVIIDVLGYDWPGNFREMNNVAARAVIGVMHTSKMIDRIAIRLALPPSHSVIDAVQGFRTMDQVIAEHIERALAAAHGNRLKASQLMAWPYTTLSDKIKEYKIDESRFKPPKRPKNKRHP